MAGSGSHRVARQQTAKGGSLLRQLTSNANLPSYIRQLPPRTLNNLITEIGLEDSQEILALVSAEQMKQVLSVALWSGGRPGQEEVLDLGQFIRWVDLWMQDGEQTLVQQVQQLGEDFVVMCLSKLLTAVDRTVVGLEEGGLEIGQYVLFPRQEQHWHRVVEMLTTLWHHEPDFVLHALNRCSFQRSILNDEVSEDGTGETLYQDILAERSVQRRSVGYVNPMHASMFLMTAKTSELRDLCSARAYDLTTADYLRQQEQQLADRVQQAPRAADPPHEAVHADGQADRHPGNDAINKSAQPKSSGQAVAADGVAADGDFAALDGLLRDAGILQEQAPVALLTAQGAARPQSELLETALALLAQDAPQVASRRMGELAYLSNVLVSGAEIQGKTFDEAEAAKATLATANLGTTYLLFKRSSEPGEVQRAADLLAEDPGAIRLFQIGYHLLCALPARCADAVYRAKAVQARRPGHVVIREMDEVLGSSRLIDRVNEGAYGEAKALIDGLSAVLDSAACIALRRLIDPTPCFPRVLDGGTDAENIYVDKGYRHIATMQDIERIAAFLNDLPSYCGN